MKMVTHLTTLLILAATAALVSQVPLNGYSKKLDSMEVTAIRGGQGDLCDSEVTSDPCNDDPCAQWETQAICETKACGTCTSTSVYDDLGPGVNVAFEYVTHYPGGCGNTKDGDCIWANGTCKCSGAIGGPCNATIWTFNSDCIPPGS